MKKQKLASIVLILILFICLIICLTGCSNDEIEKLRNENTQLQTRVNQLEEKIKNLEDKQIENKQINEINIYSNRSELIPITYWSYEEKKRLIKNDSEVLIYPQEGATAIALVHANAVVEVLEAGATNKLWLYVLIPTYDSPIDNHGWILEEDTEPLTKDNQKQVLGDVYVKKGITIYRVDTYEQILSATPSVLGDDNRGWIDEKKGDYVLLSCPGGKSFWVLQKDINYPSVE